MASNKSLSISSTLCCYLCPKNACLLQTSLILRFWCRNCDLACHYNQLDSGIPSPIARETKKPMSMSIAELPPAKLNVIWKGVRKAIKRLLPLVLAAVFIPKVLAAYLACGLIDVLRNSRPNLDLLQRYFVGNGLLTWLLSPFNLLMDLLTIPYWNKGVYQLNDLQQSLMDFQYYQVV